MNFYYKLKITLGFICLVPFVFGQQKASTESTGFTSETFTALSFRSIGPAVTSGWISDFAVMA